MISFHCSVSVGLQFLRHQTCCEMTRYVRTVQMASARCVPCNCRQPPTPTTSHIDYFNSTPIMISQELKSCLSGIMNCPKYDAWGFEVLTAVDRKTAVFKIRSPYWFYKTIYHLILYLMNASKLAPFQT